MLTILTGGEAEFTVQRSRFIAYAEAVHDEDEARAFLAKIRKEHYDARHCCSAWVLGADGAKQKSSDDGEPGGTAGMPILNVIDGAVCTDVVIVVTRYFGGTLLGTGGLVHAYGDGAKNVLSVADFEELVEKTKFSLSCDYQQYQVVKKIFENFTLYDVGEDFGEAITIKGEIAAIDFDTLKQKIFDSTNGKVLPIINS